MNFIVESSEPPVVEIDSTVRAAYIRFRKSKVVKTINQVNSKIIVTIDVDRNNNVVGVELIGVREFSLTALLKKLPFLTVKAPIERARYMPARLVQLEEEEQLVCTERRFLGRIKRIV